jgi:uncharacterized protein
MLRTLAVLSMAALVGAVATMSRAASDAPAPGEVQKMEAALPAKAQVQPAKPRKVLVFSLARIYVHPTTAMGVKTFEALGKKTGAWETVASDDPQMFAADKLAAFDAVVFNNTSGDCFDDPTLQKNLLDFVKGGKGFVGIHGAADTFHDWKEYGEMLGGRFNGHPWRVAAVKIDDPKSPLNAAFDGGFKIMEEIYTFKEPFSRQTNHVLLSMDWPASKLGGGNRTDNDYALAWCRPYGQGRVFYSAFGNDASTYSNPLILKHWCDGIQYAIGDLKADATPGK